MTVKKITCGNDTYCSGSTCEPCPAAETCDGESCCALTGPNDVCGRPTKEVGTLTTVTHSDLNANGCCEETTEESCSLNPVTPRTCTPTCDGTCQSDGSCRPDCETGYSYNETAGQCCADLTETDCQKLVPASSGVCPRLEHVSTEGFPCTTTDGQSGTCQSGTCTPSSQCDAQEAYKNETVCKDCGWEWVCPYVGFESLCPDVFEFECGGNSFCRAYNGGQWLEDYNKRMICGGQGTCKTGQTWCTYLYLYCGNRYDSLYSGSNCYDDTYIASSIGTCTDDDGNEVNARFVCSDTSLSS